MAPRVVGVRQLPRHGIAATTTHRLCPFRPTRTPLWKPNHKLLREIETPAASLSLSRLSRSAPTRSCLGTTHVVPVLPCSSAGNTKSPKLWTLICLKKLDDTSDDTSEPCACPTGTDEGCWNNPQGSRRKSYWNKNNGPGDSTLTSKTKLPPKSPI